MSQKLSQGRVILCREEQHRGSYLGDPLQPIDIIIRLDIGIALSLQQKEPLSVPR